MTHGAPARRRRRVAETNGHPSPSAGDPVAGVAARDDEQADARATVRRLAADVAHWAAQANVSYLNRVDVPGASDLELRALSALGAIAGQLRSGSTKSLPSDVREWIAHAEVDVPDQLISAIQGAQSHEVLARAYELIVSGRNRRVLGTFFTPTPIVDHMIALCEQLAGSPDVVIDPGAGVGAFTQAALNRWPSATVSAIDVNVVTLGLLAACVPATQQDRLQLVFENYLTWSTPAEPANTDAAVGTVADAELGAGVDSGTGPDRHSGLARITIGNPPYTRHQHLSREDKDLAQAAAGELVFSGLAGLSTYFAAVAVRSLAPADSACLLLPGNWCQARYGRELRSWLWAADQRQVRVQMFPASAEVFPGTQVTAMVLYVGPEQSSAQPLWVEELVLSGTAGSSAADDVSDALQTTTVVTARQVLKDRRQPCPELFTLGAATSGVKENSVRLSDIARVRRGVATGANKFFFLTDEQQATLPAEVVKPALVKASQLRGTRLDAAAHQRIGTEGGQRWLLAIPEGFRPRGALADYLRSGESAGYDKRHLTAVRTTWYCVETVQPPDLFFAPFARGQHRVIVNDAAAIGSNNLYGIYLSDDCDWTAVGLARWFARQENEALVTSISRSYQGTSHKLEPGDLARLTLPASAHKHPAKVRAVGRQLRLV